MKKSVVASVALAIPCALTLVVLSGCSSGDSDSPGSAGATRAGIEQPTSTSSTSSTSSTFVPVAESCLLQLDDLATLKPPVPNQYDRIEAGQGSESLDCSYQGGNGYVEIDEYNYGESSTAEYGDGSKALYGATCADGSTLTEDLQIGDLQETRKRLESHMICETEPVTNTAGFKQGSSRKLEVNSEVFRDIGEGLYCIIPSNCFLLTQEHVYQIGLTRSTNGSFSAASTYSQFGGYEGTKEVANLIASVEASE